MTSIFLSLGWLVGLYLGLAGGGEPQGGGEQLAAPPQITTSILSALFALAGVAAFLSREDRRLRVTALAVGLGVLGIARALSLAPGPDPLLDRTGSVVIHGSVASRPEVRDSHLQMVLEVEELWRQGTRERARGRVLVRADRYQEWGYGDRVVAWGSLRPLEMASGYWAQQLSRQGIHTLLEYPAMRLRESPSGPDLRRAVDGLRDRLERLCVRLLPEPQASLLAGILVGARASMPPEFRDALNATSTSHIVAVSGFNVTVVAGLAQLTALRFLARRKATLLAIAAVWLYSLLTGLPPSAFRAALMATLGLSAILVGRGSDALSFLLLSGAFMAGLDPYLLFDLGFQLSFLATAGLVLLEPVLRGWFGRLPGWLAASLSVTLAAQIATLPVLVGSFHILSMVSPLANLLIAPMLPGVMVAGGLAVGLGALFEPAGQLLAPLAWLYLTYLVEVIRWTARLPGAVISVGSLGFWTVLAYYLLLLVVGFWPAAEMRATREAVRSLAGRLPVWVWAGAVAATLSLGLLALSDRPDGNTHLYFLDVGHGDATLIRSGAGHSLLVDGGPSPVGVADALGRRLGFQDRGLDGVVLTGYGEDRLAGLLEVVRRHPVGFVLQPGSPPKKGAGWAWAELLRERGVPVVRAVAGQRISLGDEAWLEVVWAPAEGSEEEPSMVLKLVAGGIGVLLPGDLDRGVQAEIARGAPGRMELLRLPRHGAAGSLDAGFLQAISPRAVVVSVRADNPFRHPADATVAMLGNSLLLRTDRHGTVEMVIGREGYELLTER
ncbi:MAG: ComEC/Rec2 family competence protein [Chloroflexota bacterium]